MDIAILLNQTTKLPEKDVLGMILSNRIDTYAGDKFQACISIKSFDQLINDLITWSERHRHN